MPFVAQIDLALSEKLKTDLLAQGFSLSSAPHALFSAKKKGVSCTLYESGKLVVQGKEMDEFIEFYLEPEILKNFSYSHPDVDLDLTPRIGMDEAGKGDFFGPLCVASLYADEKGIEKIQKLKIKDSKKLSDKKVREIARTLKKEFSCTIIRLFPKKYNELYARFKNLNRLLAWAHAAALLETSSKTGCKKAILDQFVSERLVEQFLEQKKVVLDLEQRVRAEEDLVVAAASILARNAFLEGMDRLSEECGFPLPKGAGAQVKLAAQKLLKENQSLEQFAKTHFKTAKELS